MPDGPIMFTPPNVKAILEGRKTHTRRLGNSPLCRHSPGDFLWVRERTRVLDLPTADTVQLRYEADQKEVVVKIPDRLKREAIVVGKCLSMGCFKEASRIRVMLRESRLERLHAISEADAIAEGLEPGVLPGFWRDPVKRTVDHSDPRQAYRSLWDSLHPPAKRWDSNPLLLVLIFSEPIMMDVENPDA